MNWDAQAGPDPPKRPRKDEILAKCFFISDLNISERYIILTIKSHFMEFFEHTNFIFSGTPRRVGESAKIPNISNLTTIESILK